MTADPAVQLRLLDLQAADSALARLSHRRATLPQLAELGEVAAQLDAITLRVIAAETTRTDVAAEQRRLENEVDAVRTRAGRDEARLATGGLPSKELSNLQHEVTSLARRQGTLEDELLEVMEQLEQAESELGTATTERDAALGRQAELESARDAEFESIDRDAALLTHQRAALAIELPDDLLAQYDRIRASAGGVGAAAIRQRRCEGCRIDLSGAELTTARTAAPEVVLRCENCRRILVRTATSGL